MALSRVSLSRILFQAQPGTWEPCPGRRLAVGSGRWMVSGPWHIDALHPPRVLEPDPRSQCREGTRRRCGQVPRPLLRTPGTKGKQQLGSAPGRRGQPGCARRPRAHSRRPRPSGLAPGLIAELGFRDPARAAGQTAPRLQPQPGLADRSAAATRAMKMHFCIPVSQQRPDALGGRYTVRPGPGSSWAGRRQ